MRKRGGTEEAGAGPGIFGAGIARFSEVGLSRNGVFGRQTGFESTIEYGRVKFAWWMRMAGSWV